MNATIFAPIAATEPLALRLLRDIVHGDRNAVDRARLFLNAVAPENWPPLHREAMAGLIAMTAAHFGFCPGDLIDNRSRTARVTKARHVAMYLCRHVLEIPFEEMAPTFKRHHTTIIFACNAINDRCETDRIFAEEVRTLTETAEKMKLANPQKQTQ